MSNNITNNNQSNVNFQQSLQTQHRPNSSNENLLNIDETSVEV
jgi:hypothetical protein